MIKTGGANVAPEEIDAVVGNWPGVKRSQTVGVPDALLGEAVVTCLVPLEGEEIDRDGLVRHLKSKLASFKVPRKILICTDEEFALTGNDKVKSADIRALAASKLRQAV
jgi:acyl-CoA synthetase (AMP-forming)/AMP-acid ligase II